MLNAISVGQLFCEWLKSDAPALKYNNINSRSSRNTSPSLSPCSATLSVEFAFIEGRNQNILRSIRQACEKCAREIYIVRPRLSSCLEKLVRRIVGAKINEFIVVEVQIVEGKIDGVIVVFVLESFHKCICPCRLPASLEARQAENVGAFG